MKNSPNKRGVIVGLFIFVGLLLLVVCVLIIGNLHETFKKKTEIVTLFYDVSGLQVGNNIWFSGVKIGTVSSLKFYAVRRVKVMMKIEDKAVPYIHQDAFVKLSTDGLIGNKILVIYGGTSRTPQVSEGDTLRVEKTFTSDDMINTLQENNKNLLEITNDLKIISHKIAGGEGTIGKLISDNSLYAHLDSATLSLQNASIQAKELINSLTTFSKGLNKKGTLANELTTDTVVYKSIRASVLHLQQMSDNANVFINNLKEASTNPHSTIGVLLHDEESGTRLKQTIKNLESGTLKLDQDLEAAQSSFLLKGFFRKQAKEKKAATTTNATEIK
jgi:phospholipid/cholesterol/gamma-HCH transport system substrate-binding protein